MLFSFFNSEYYVPLIFHAKSQLKYLVGLEKKLILLFLLFLVTAPSWIFDLIQFYNSETIESGHALCEI